MHTVKHNDDFRRIFIGVVRPHAEVLAAEAKVGAVVAVSFQHLGSFMTLRGAVEQVDRSHEGTLVFIRPVDKSVMGWNIVPLWVPYRYGECGILCVWPPKMSNGMLPWPELRYDGCAL